MKIIFDYTYYRIAKFYFKRDGSEAVTALLTITLVHFLYLLSIVFFLIGIFEIGRRKTSTLEKTTIVIVIFLIFLYNKRNYNGKYFNLREKWKNETKKMKIRNGILIILFVLSPLFLIILISHYFGRTNF
jgi:membrane protein YdbS with pleckstrin-like domain